MIKINLLRSAKIREEKLRRKKIKKMVILGGLCAGGVGMFVLVIYTLFLMITHPHKKNQDIHKVFKESTVRISESAVSIYISEEDRKLINDYLKEGKQVTLEIR